MQPYPFSQPGHQGQPMPDPPSYSRPLPPQHSYSSATSPTLRREPQRSTPVTPSLRPGDTYAAHAQPSHRPHPSSPINRSSPSPSHASSSPNMMPSGNVQSGGYFNGPFSGAQRQQGTYPPSNAPSYSDQGYHDYTADYHGRNDDDFETKSFNSHSHLNTSKEYGVGAVVPSINFAPPAPIGHDQYPPSPSLMGYPPPAHANPINRLPTTPSFSGSSHWHSVRNQLLARRVVKQIPLFNGNLVMDVPVPKGVVPASTGAVGAEPGEMEKLRYSAATCDPDDFTRRKFHLRQYLYGRRTELFIVMTMYNEDSILLLRTLNAVIKNIAHLCSRTRSKTWGSGSWRKVVVCIVADGRNKCDPRVLKVLQLMGVYAEGVAKDTVAGKEVQAHIYEYTTQVVVSETGEVGFGAVPVQVIFCLKESNKKKLNSHRWFFNAFGPQVKPNVCALLDVGTKPSGTSLYELYKCFEKHPNVGGACGEIYADSGKWGRYLLNPIVAGQNFEYKMSNILDKPFESVFGFISVLPGAFSAYRYAAVANHPDGTGPLASYFHGEKMNEPGVEASIFDRNMFLAEDRILAFEIVTKKNAKWRLQYVKSAKAGTDVPSGVPEFISQRRRWLNGSIFASFYALYSFWRVWTSGHNIIRKFALMILTFYNFVNLLFNWLSISSYYLAFYFLLQSSVSAPTDPFGGAGDEIFQVFNKVYIAILFIVLVCSLGNRPQGSRFMYTACIILFAVCQGILLYCAGFTVYQTVPHTAEGWTNLSELFSNRTFLDLAMSLMATYGLYLISSLMYLEPWHMITSFIQYLFLLPSYVNILLIYAFCNLHDVSWGTKGDNGSAKDLGQAKKVKNDDGEEALEVALPTRQEDVEALWQQARAEIRTPPKEVKEKRDATTKRSDSDRNFRTNVVLLFLGSNMIIILLFTSTAFTGWISQHFAEATSGTFNPYLTVIFYAVLFLSAMRFLGCTLYLIFRIFGF